MLQTLFWTYYVNQKYTKETLDWEAKKNFAQMSEDGWRWQSNNLDGYNT